MWSRDFVYHQYVLSPDVDLRDIGRPLVTSDSEPPEPEPRPFDHADRDEEFASCP